MNTNFRVIGLTRPSLQLQRQTLYTTRPSELSKVTLVKLYYSFVYPYPKYGTIAWGNSRKALLQKVQVAQNKILRIINFKSLKDRVKMSTLYKDMKILQVKDIFEIEVAKFMHSFHHDNLPCIFDSYYESVATQHNHNARSIANKNYYLQRMHSQSGQSALNYVGVTIWNKILLHVKLHSKYLLSKQLKNILISKY